MVKSVIVDTTFLAALLRERDALHEWAAEKALQHSPAWHTCEAVLTETYFFLGPANSAKLSALLRSSIRISFDFEQNRDATLEVLEKYARVPMSFADACLVRMSETLNEPVILTADSDFRTYRRHSRKVIPCVLPD